MAGNGRGMVRKAEKENRERSNKASGTRRAAAKTSTPSTRKAETSAGEKAEKKKPTAKAAADQATAKPGADLLEAAADAVVKERCNELAHGLAEAAKKGNASCAKMLLGLAERVRTQKEGADAKEGRSAANLLASEPDWPGAQGSNSQSGSGAAETTAAIGSVEAESVQAETDNR